MISYRIIYLWDFLESLLYNTPCLDCNPAFAFISSFACRLQSTREAWADQMSFSWKRDLYLLVEARLWRRTAHHLRPVLSQGKVSSFHFLAETHSLHFILTGFVLLREIVYSTSHVSTVTWTWTTRMGTLSKWYSRWETSLVSVSEAAARSGQKDPNTRWHNESSIKD